MADIQYQVKMRPLLTLSAYHLEEDVSDFIADVDVSNISRQLETFDFDVGVYRYDSITIVARNINGKFNNAGDFFTLKRDLAKVTVNYLDKDVVSRTVFNGLISEDGSRAGVNNDSVKFLVIASDYVLNQIQVISGDISNGDTIKVAIDAILNKTGITLALGFDTSKINPTLSTITVDDASSFTGKPTKQVLNDLLLASNSIFFVDSTGDMVVASRTVTGVPVTFYGEDEPFGRENIIQLTYIDEGKSRVYNSIVVNTRETKDATSITDNGLRQKTITLAFITNTANEDAIAASYLAEFKDPKKETEITVKSSDAGSLQFLDEIKLDILATNYQNINITTSDRWKILGLNESPSNFVTTIKLREI